jgi:hypothetical protein
MINDKKDNKTKMDSQKHTEEVTKVDIPTRQKEPLTTEKLAEKTNPLGSK